MEKVEVQSSMKLKDEQNFLVNQCIAVLRQGIDLIAKLDESVYRHSEPSEKSSVGAHFRHNLDFVTNFLRGLETGRLDYNARERNLQVETNPKFAVAQFQAAVFGLENLTSADLEKKLIVRSETVKNLWCESSAMRELEFLQSHTIHHYALIQKKLASLGIVVSDDFGVAPSTLEFWQSQTA